MPKNDLILKLDPTKKYVLMVDEKVKPQDVANLIEGIKKSENGDFVVCVVPDIQNSLRFVEMDEKTAIEMDNK